jgi:PAS domain S-box-containing protein
MGNKATYQQLEQKIKELEARIDNKQLTKSEQQLEYVNQQLYVSNQQLQASEQQLKSLNQQLEANNQQLRSSEDEVKKHALHLGERIKELNCLYKVFKSIRERAKIVDVFQDVVYIIPSGWHYPNITRAKIIYDDKRYVSQEFKETKWKQSANIVINDVVEGSIEVYYMEKRPEISEGPFMIEERHLLDEIAKNISQAIKQKQVEQEIRKLSKVVDRSNQAVVITSLEGNIVYVNNELLRLGGWDEENELVNNLMYIFLDEKSIKKVKENILPLVFKKGTYRGEVLLKRKNNSFFPAEMNVSVITNESGEIEFLAAMFTDITERKKAVETVRKSENDLRALFNAMTDSVYEIDYNGKYIYVAPTSPELLFKSAEEIIGKTLHELFPKEDANMFLSVVQESLDKNKTISFQYTLLIDGKTIWFEGRSTPKTKDTVLFIAHDISKRKKIEDEIKESEEKYKALVENSYDGIYIYKDDNFLFVNNTIIDILGYTKKELLKKNIWEIIHPDDRDRIIQLGKDRAKNINVPVTYTAKIICGDNVLKDAEFLVRIINYNGEYAVLGTVRDISEKKQSEEKLKESEAKFREFAEMLPQGAFEIDLKGNVIFLNKNGYSLFGYAMEELEGEKLNIYDYFPSNGIERLKNNIKNKINIKSDNAEEYIIQRKNGDEFPILVYSDIIKENNIPIGIRGIIIDISEQKKSQQELIRLSTAVKQSPSVIAITDTKGDFEYVNPQFTKLTGYTSEETKGQNPRLLKFGGQSKEIYKDLWDTISSGKTWSGEFHNKKKNGELFWESASVSPIIDNDGKTINFLKVAEDISERKYSEKVQKVIYNISNAVITTDSLDDFINLTEKHLSSIIDTTNFYIVFYDENIDKLNFLFSRDKKDNIKVFPEGKSLTSYIIKNKMSLLATKETREKLVKENKIDKLGTDSKIWLGVPLILRNKAIGAIVVQSYENEAAYNEKDMEVLNIISGQISISIERKKAEEELNKALKDAKESDKLKSAFLANMSHEIRTPLNCITGFIELISMSEISDEKREQYVDIINSSSTRLLTTIDDLLDISRIEAGQVRVSKTKTSLNKLLEELNLSFSNEVNNKELKLVMKQSLSKETDIVFTDNDMLHAVLTNLIKNAIKFTEKGAIEFGYIVKNDVIEFFVKDSGIGIPKEKMQSIFNRFEQVDMGNTRVKEGTGLGLAISAAYIKLLDGKIWIESEVETKNKAGWTIFRFTIPFETKEIKIVEKVEETPLKLSKKMNDLSIIIAEDEEANLIYLRAILEKHFSEVFVAKNGIKAVEMCQKNPEVSFILMDIKMPLMSGHQATREIRKFNKEVIIIAQTAYALEGDKEKALLAGCNDYISKPINSANLIGKLKLHLKK